ncbi:MAG TPA: hypothetical protein VGO62_08535, partial [Myxococcota bacterium]
MKPSIVPLVVAALTCSLAACVTPEAPRAPHPLPLAHPEAGTSTGNNVAGEDSAVVGPREPVVDVPVSDNANLHLAAGYCPTCDALPQHLDDSAALAHENGALAVQGSVVPRDEDNTHPEKTGTGTSSTTTPAAPSAPAELPAPRDIVTVTATDAAEPLPRGASGLVTIHLAIAPQHHVLAATGFPLRVACGNS